jgi:hypothetical protein
LLASDQIAIEPAAHVEAKLFVPGMARAPIDLAEANLDASLAPHPATASPSLWVSPWFWSAVGVLVAGSVTAVILETR